MRVCLMIEGQEDVTWEQWAGLARACEEHGLEGLFRSDHYTSVFDIEDRGSLDAWTTLAALATVTERIRLGTLVSPATFRHPSLLAKAVVTADHVSGGRVELGIGAGWHRREHAAYGFPFPETGERMDLLAEQIEIVHRQWSEDEVSFEGRHYRLDAVRALPGPVQDPHPPLIVGGHAGPRSVALAARWADEYNVFSSTPAECAEMRARVAGAWEREGRDRLVFSLMTGCVVGRDAGLLEHAEALHDLLDRPHDPGGMPAPEGRRVGRHALHPLDGRDALIDLRGVAPDDAARHQREDEPVPPLPLPGPGHARPHLGALLRGRGEDVVLVGPSRGERDGPRPRVAAHDQGRVRVLHGLGERLHRLEPVVLPLERDLVLAPLAVNDLDLLGKQIHPLPRLREREPVGRVLPPVPARADAQLHAAAGDVVGGHHRLGQERGVPEGRRGDERAQPDPPGGGPPRRRLSGCGRNRTCASV